MTIGTRTRQLSTLGASSNDSRKVTDILSNLDVIKGTDISFSSTNTISSDGNAFGTLSPGQIVQVAGSPLNSRTYSILTAAAGSITVTPALVQAEVAGAAIQIYEV